jgi:GNAT superfamily N-acetyltransferase
MSTAKLEILPFDGKGATPAEYEALNKHNNRMRKERLPDDPPVPLEETTQNLQSLPPFVDVRLWAAWTPGQAEMVGLGDVILLRTEENQHLAQFELSVLPEYRRQGLGKRLLRLIAETAQEDKRRLLMTNTVDRVPGGEAFMRRMGAQKGLEAHTNQLRMEELNRNLVEDWLRRGQANLEEFELGLWEGAYPEDKIQEVSDLYELTNQQPHGELEIEDMHMTPEQLRQMETNIFARGNQRWTFYAIDRASGKFAGYTEMIWNPSRPQILRRI